MPGFFLREETLQAKRASEQRRHLPAQGGPNAACPCSNCTAETTWTAWLKVYRQEWLRIGKEEGDKALALWTADQGAAFRRALREGMCLPGLQK